MPGGKKKSSCFAAGCHIALVGVMLCFAADNPALLLTVYITGTMDTKNAKTWQQKGFLCFINIHPSHIV